VLDDIDDAQALLVVAETARRQPVQDALARMAERRVAEIVTERDCLGELLVEPQHLGDAARNLRHLEGVREARPVVVARRREEDLRLVLQAPERLRVNDPVAVALEDRPDRIFGLRAQPAAARRAAGGLRGQVFGFESFELLTDGRHRRAGRDVPVYRTMSARKLVPCASAGTPNSSASVWPRSA